MSVNDPQWGRRGGGGSGNDPSGGNDPGKGKNQGPPDLDELWRNFNERLSGMFGKKGSSGPSSGGTPPSLKQLGGGIGLILILALVVWLASGFFIVDARQQAVVYQFGKYQRTENEGLKWRLPYPIQSHELVDTSQVRNIEIGFQEVGGQRRRVPKEALMLTEDNNIVDVQFSVQYIVQDVRAYLFNNRRPDESVKQVAETAIREVVGKSKMDFVLYEGREKIAADTAKLMQDVLARYQTGIAVQRVNMQQAQPPEQVQAAFDDAVKAGQDRERAKNEGEAYANDVIPKARGAAARLLEEANGYRQSIVANAEGEASRFEAVLREYEKAPQVTRDRLYLDTVQQIMSSTTKVMIDAKQNNNMLFLPLDRLMQMTGSAGASDPLAPARPPAVESPPPAQEPLSRREMLRGRDRDGR
jgi:modulator of FtsH protease HflK